MSFATLERKSESEAPSTARALFNGLLVGDADSALEREADRVANEVGAGETPRIDWSLSGMSIGAGVQRKCACSGSSQFEKCAENKMVQRKADGAVRGGDAPSIVHEVLNSPGQPLEPATRTSLEHRFGRDFTKVRVHADSRAAESASAVQAQAYTVGHSIVLGAGHGSGTEADRLLLAHELVHTVQQERSGTLALQRQAQPAPELKLVDDFAAKFPAAAKLIKPNPAAMRLVKEAFDTGAKFGGYAEEGPEKTLGRAYTNEHTVYVPKNRADPPVLAMSDFLFELNNAIRAPKFAALVTTATKGAKTDVAAAKQYAHDTAEGEVEGMLRLGEVWFETKAKYLGKQAHAFDKYDTEFYLAEYQSFKDKKKTKDDIVQDVLKRKYETGTLKGKTVEQFYMEQYQDLAH